MRRTTPPPFGRSAAHAPAKPRDRGVAVVDRREPLLWYRRYRAAPFVITMFVMVVILVYFPQTALFLPETFYRQ